MAPFQFAMNDVYLRDTSRKVKQTLDMKRKKGKYAACPPYGYKKRSVPPTSLFPMKIQHQSSDRFLNGHQWDFQRGRLQTS